MELFGKIWKKSCFLLQLTDCILIFIFSHFIHFRPPGHSPSPPAHPPLPPPTPPPRPPRLPRPPPPTSPTLPPGLPGPSPLDYPDPPGLPGPTWTLPLDPPPELDAIAAVPLPEYRHPALKNMIFYVILFLIFDFLIFLIINEYYFLVSVFWKSSTWCIHFWDGKAVKYIRHFMVVVENV